MENHMYIVINQYVVFITRTQNAIPNTNINMKKPVCIYILGPAYLSQGHKMQYRIPNIHMKYPVCIVIL